MTTDQILANEAQQQAEFEANTVVDGYTIKALRAAFDAVQAADWKAPVDATVPSALADMTAKAIMFFQASRTRVVWQSSDGRTVHVRSYGYQA